MIRKLSAVVVTVVVLADGAQVAQAGGAAAHVTVHRVAASAYLVGMGCETSSICFGVGASAAVSSEGSVVTITSGVPGATVTVPSIGPLNDITCWSSTRCVAVGDTSAATEGALVPLTNGAPGTGRAVAGTQYLSSAACLAGGSGTCYATGESTSNQGLILPIVNGVPGTAIPVKGTTNLSDITCPSSTTCYAAGDHEPSFVGVVVTLVGGAVTKVSKVAAASALNGIGCTSASACYATGAKAASSASIVVTVTAGVAGTTQTYAAFTLAHIVCVPGGNCLGSGFMNSPARGMLTTIAAGMAGAALRVNGTQVFFKAYCPKATSCIVAGERAHFTMGLIADAPV